MRGRGEVDARLQKKGGVPYTLDDPDADMRAVASNILREIGNAVALPNLQRALGKEANPNDRPCMEVTIEFIRKRS